MNISLIMIGKTNEDFVRTGVKMYLDRLSHYVACKEIIIPDLKDRKNYSPEQIKTKEAALIFDKIPDNSYTILLDESGTEYTSVGFSVLMQKHMTSGMKELVFIIVGAYGVDRSVSERAGSVISLSKMTFTHQFVRLILAEQLYRSMTILKNEPYHNS